MKKTLKKVIALLCTLALAISAVPAIAKADTPATAFTYKSVDGKTIEITGYTGTDTKVVIPAIIDNKPVTTIGAAAFRGNTLITEVQMINVVNVKDSAFSGCSNLTTVWSFHLGTIGDSAFEDCIRLSQFPLPTTCTQIGADAFVNCAALTSMEIPSSVTTLANHCVGFMRVGTTYTTTPTFTMQCTANSAAMQYAVANRIKYTVNGSVVNPNDLANATITTIPEQYYTGKEITPVLTVRYGNTTLSPLTDYTVTYTNNKNIGTATATIIGKGSYTGSQITTFRIVGKNIATATVANIPDQIYTGKAITPTLTVKDGLLTTLKYGVDYTVAYTNNVEVGTATATITGIGAYGGTRVVTFNITANTINITAKDHYFSYNANERKFTIKATASPSADLKYTTDSDGVSIITKKKSSGNVGELTMEAGFSGKAIINITATKSGYQTSVKQITILVPPAVKLTEATRTGSKSATITWETNNLVNGYTLQYSTSSKFTVNTKELSVTGANRKITGLEKNQDYYIRIRSNVEFNGVEYYSKWSSVKHIEATVAPSLLYERYLQKQSTRVEKILSYAFYDFNRDGVDELLIKYYNGGNRNCGKVCTIVDGTVKMIKNQKDGSPSFYHNAKKELMLDSSNSSKEKVYRIYQMKNNKLTLVRTYRSTVKEDGKREYTLNGKKIKKSEFTKMKKDFTKLDTTNYEG